MPKASVNKHRKLCRSEYDIRLTRQSPIMKPITQSCRVQRAPNAQFRFCVPAADGCHNPAARGGRHMIHDGQVLLGVAHPCKMGLARNPTTLRMRKPANVLSGGLMVVAEVGFDPTTFQVMSLARHIL